jgi:hypothetical protein
MPEGIGYGAIKKKPQKRKRPTKAEREKKEREDAYNLADKEAYKKAHNQQTLQTLSSKERERKLLKILQKGGWDSQTLKGAVKYLNLRDKQEDLAADKQEKRAGRVAKAQMRYKQKQRRKRGDN